MKTKNLLLLCSILAAGIIYGQTPSIPNGNFEQWTSATCDNPQYYSRTSNSDNFFRFNLPFNVIKTTDAYHGSYAVQLNTIAAAGDTAAAYFLNTNPNGDPPTWSGGMAYNQKPKGIRGYYKYNVATADSATIIVAFSKAGTNIGTYMFTIGGIHSTYTLFNYSFSPALTLTPDSVVFAAVSSKLSGSKKKPTGLPGSTLKMDSISFTGVSSQPALMNGDFELWQSQTYNTPSNWFVQSDNGSGFYKTTDAKAGAYAIELKTYLGNNNNNPVARGGSVGTGYYPNNCGGSCNELGGFPFSKQVDTLTFWYKYVPSGNDSASVSMNFKKNGSNVWGTGVSLHAAASYQYKEIPFNVGQNPDTVMIQIQSSAWNDTLLSFIGSDLKVDEMHFKSQPLSTDISDYRKEKAISIFPNPSTGKIHIQTLGFTVQNLEIYNILGDKVYMLNDMKQQQSNELDLSSFQKGIYFIKIYDEGNAYTEKIIIQ